MAKKSTPENLFTEDEWLPVDDPMVGEVIRWQEPIWAPTTAKKKSTNAKRNQIGVQSITAEILSITDNFYLFVEDVSQVSSLSGAMFKKLAVEPGTKITRRIESVLAQGNCERLKWLDEDIRAFHAEDPKRKRLPTEVD